MSTHQSVECSQATEGSECIGGVSATAGASHGGTAAAWLFSGTTASSSSTGSAERKNDVAWEKSRANWFVSFGVFGVFGVFGSVR